MRAVWIILGIVGVLVGALWTLQGLNIIKSGFMAGNTMWAIIGPIVVVVGLLLLLYGSRSRKTRAE
jgi:uncharacterized membrane protein YeaQ/YmgE (transglycosylase-associated protein family)